MYVRLDKQRDTERWIPGGAFAGGCGLEVNSELVGIRCRGLPLHVRTHLVDVSAAVVPAVELTICYLAGRIDNLAIESSLVRVRRPLSLLHEP
jgi:hypothetical protein